MTLFAASTAVSIIRVVYTSIISSVLVAAIFAVAVVSLVRSVEMRRASRSTAAFGYRVVALAALTVCGASVVYGLILLGQKG
jgi:hypothetical protein